MWARLRWGCRSIRDGEIAVAHVRADDNKDRWLVVVDRNRADAGIDALHEDAGSGNGRARPGGSLVRRIRTRSGSGSSRSVTAGAISHTSTQRPGGCGSSSRGQWRSMIDLSVDGKKFASPAARGSG